MSDDIAAWVRIQLDHEAANADEIHTRDCDSVVIVWTDSTAPERVGPCNCGRPARVLAEVEAKRRTLDLHAPVFEIVEWPDDQTGKGEAWVCSYCSNRDIDAWTDWHPAIGEAGVFPPGVKAPYIIAPCPTLRLLALPYAGHDGYRSEWAP